MKRYYINKKHTSYNRWWGFIFFTSIKSYILVCSLTLVVEVPSLSSFQGDHSSSTYSMSRKTNGVVFALFFFGNSTDLSLFDQDDLSKLVSAGLRSLYAKKRVGVTLSVHLPTTCCLRR
jgi:hypothetical protein